jgi:hypothetical protein
MKVTVSLDTQDQKLLEELMASHLYRGERTPEQVLLWALRMWKGLLDAASEWETEGLDPDLTRSLR